MLGLGFRGLGFGVCVLRGRGLELRDESCRFKSLGCFCKKEGFEAFVSVLRSSGSADSGP